MYVIVFLIVQSPTPVKREDREKENIHSILTNTPNRLSFRTHFKTSETLKFR